MISFKFGGGNHARTINPEAVDCKSNAEQLQLEIKDPTSGKWSAVWRQTGSNNRKLIHYSKTYSGECRKARLRAYDLNAGGWGYLLLDHVQIYGKG